MCYAIDRDSYRHILMASVMKQRETYEKALAQVKIVQDLDPYERSQMADALQSCEYKAGEVGARSFYSRCFIVFGRYCPHPAHFITLMWDVL